MEHMTEARGEAVHVCARILLKCTFNVDEENKVGGKLTVWFRSLLSLLGEPTRRYCLEGIFRRQWQCADAVYG